MKIIQAFKTKNDFNQLTQADKIELVTEITKNFGGVTLTEHMGGYHMDDGTNDIKYSYEFEIFGEYSAEVLAYFIKLARENGQESIAVNGSIVYLAQ